MAQPPKKEKIFSIKSPSPPPQPPIILRADSPAIHLKGENLEYYRNIAYLKEVTRQANALLDRSNAKYENILDDQKLGYRARTASSEATKSLSAEMEGRCRRCGLAHGAVDFCIVEKIMNNEKQNEEEKRRRSKISRGSWSYQQTPELSTDSKSLKNQADSNIPTASVKKALEDHIWKKVNILEKMTPSQILDTYATLCARYGPNAGRQFLLANSLVHPSEGKIEQWLTSREQRLKRTPELTKRPLPQYDSISKDCPEAKPIHRPLCPEVSPEVMKKMATIAHLVPPCEAQPPDNHEKNWRAVFQKHPVEPNSLSPTQSDWKNDQIEFESSFAVPSCNCPVQQCVCGTETICETPKVQRKCTLTRYEDDYENNYLLTIRKQIWKQRETKRQETMMLLKQSVAVIFNKRTKSEDFLENARMEQFKTLKNCLSMNVNEGEYDCQEFNKNIQEVADAVAPTSAVTARQWDRWLEQMKEQEKIEERDELDSLSSDIHTDDGSESLISHSTRFKIGRIKPTRIPCSEDIYDLIDNLYDKISLKFEKCIVKNSFKVRRLSYKPNYAYFHQRMKLLSSQSPVFQEIMLLGRFDSYPKRLIPFKVRKNRKLKRLEALERRLARSQRIRNMTRGLQLGKQYRKISRSPQYTAESGYVAFKLQERKVLDPKMPDRFAKFNIINNPTGKAITKKNIHHDFRLMRGMFDDAAKARREDLMDQGMLKRLYEFQKNMHNAKHLPCPPLTDSEVEDEEADSDSNTQLYEIPIPRKEDVHLLQKANSKQGHRNIPKQMRYENVHHTVEIRGTVKREAGKSNSADKLNSSKESYHTTVRRKLQNGNDSPKKCLSSTNVKGEKTKHNENPEQSKGEPNQRKGEPSSKHPQMRSSVRSLTNLLPPLKGYNAKTMVNNEFEETISALQNELANLLTHPSNGSKVEAPVKTGEISRTKSIKKRPHSTVTKLPELKTPLRRASSKMSMSKISDESLPHIKGRESMENLKPGGSQEGLQERGLTKKMSMLSIHSGKTKSRVSRKLPLLVEKSKLGSNLSDDSLTMKGKKYVTNRPKITIPAIPKQTGFKAWR